MSRSRAGRRSEYRCLPTRANLQPAVAVSLRSPGDTEFRLISVEVLWVEEGKIAEISDSSIPELLAAFGLPQMLS